MKKTAALVAIGTVLLLTSCGTTAGPFVTSITHVGNGQLLIKKCRVGMSFWANTPKNGDCTREQINVSRKGGRSK